MPRMLCSALVGREGEESRLRTAVELAVQGRGGLVLVSGCAGIGKSRLLATVETYARSRGVEVLRGRCVPSEVPAPYRPLTEALLRAPAPVASAELQPFLPALGRLVPQWRSDAAPETDESPVVVAEALVRVLRTLGGAAACVLLLEDLHWADPETLHALEYLADHTRALPVLTIASLRDDPGAAHELTLRLESRGASEVIRPEPLGEGGVSEMARACLGASSLPAELEDWLRGGAEGIPFLVEELLAAAISAGALVARDGRWSLADAMPAVVPASFAAGVAQRLGGARPQTRTVLGLAALLGRSFDWRVVAAAIGDAESVEQTLRDGVALQLLATAGGEFAFRHALTRDAVLLDLLPTERAALAARALDALEADPPPGDAWRHTAAELAETAGDLDRAASMLLDAGRQSLRRGALDSATAALARAARLGRGGALRAACLEALAEARSAAGDLAGVRTAVAGLLAALEEIDAPAERRGRAHLRLATTAIAATDYPLASEELARARRLGEAAGDRELSARVASVAAELALLEGRGGEAGVLAERAAADAEAIGLAEVVCSALEVAGRCERVRDLDRAEAAFSRALRIAEDERLPVWELRALYQLGTIELFRSGTVLRLERARELARRLGALSTVAHLELEIGAGYEFQGRREQAVAAFERCIESAAILGARLLEAIANVFLGVVEATRCARAAMEAHLERGLTLADGDPDIIGAAWGDARAIASLAAEDRGRARDELERAAGAVAGRPAVVPRPYLGMRALLLAIEGAEQAESAADGAAMIQQGAYLGFARAVTLGRAGRVAEADEQVARAESMVAIAPWYRHLLHRLCAEAAAADGWGDPQGWMREAAAFFDVDGSPRLASACRDLLRRTGARVARPTAAARRLPPVLRDAGVTGREADVLRLVGEGLSNAEIADRLFLSERTVEHHIAGLRRKLSLDSRTRMAAYAVGIAAPSA